MSELCHICAFTVWWFQWKDGNL